jgi:radical SAM superfamily enzyme YgiQ (UPF0313 family)
MYLPDDFYKGTVIRPPSEADSLILQVTLGCTDNGCIFCPAYKDKKFKVKDIADIEREIIFAAKMFKGTRRIFLADGDAIAVDREKLKRILLLLNKHFPLLSRVGLYGSVKSLETKTVKDLEELRELKLGVVYLGFETGDPEVYKLIRKYGSPQGNIDACGKVKNAGIKTNVTVILGLGGKALSGQHAVNTAKILSMSKPDQIAALTLMIVKDTPLYILEKAGKFKQLEGFQYLEELKLMIENMEDFKCLFFSNHASNYFPVSARFPKDRQQVLANLKHILETRAEGALTPEWKRGL